MRYAPGHKAEVHARIVSAAADNFRVQGINGIGVAALMKELGLTHGGFYAHFASKDALVVEAAQAAFGSTLQALREIADRAPAGKKLSRVVKAYLSEMHRDEVAASCFVASVGSEIARHDEAVRHAVGQEIKRFLALLRDCIAADGRDESPELVLSSLIGALLLSRLMRDDTKLSAGVLRSTRRALEAAASE